MTEWQNETRHTFKGMCYLNNLIFNTYILTQVVNRYREIRPSNIGNDFKYQD